MGIQLQDRRTVSDWISFGQVIEFSEKIESFSGLAEIVRADLEALDAAKLPADWRNDRVTGELHFGYADAENRLPSVIGSARAELYAVCQRCLRPFRIRLNVEPKLLLMGQDDLLDEYQDYEVWELEEQLLQPLEIVEELLIMALPFSAKHDNMKDCKAFASDDVGSDKVIRPFAALRAQMQQDE